MAGYKEISFENLETSDLYIDALYKGGTKGNVGDDPLSKLMGVGNQGGFRYIGSLDSHVNLCVLYSSLANLDWPDSFDPVSGQFVYYGDNKSPGHEIHDTPRFGNEILRRSFDSLHSGDREKIPPFFVFTKGPSGRDVFFRGLAVPGAKGFSGQADLVAVWKAKGGQRFQNYRAIFTILDEPVISSEWLHNLQAFKPFSENTPESWNNWISGGDYQPLLAPRSIAHRSKSEQLPPEGFMKQGIQFVIDYFKSHPYREYAFERCAAEIAVLMDSNITHYDLTRPWRDGGRDALGKYSIGYPDNAIEVEFALEAKCKGFKNGSGVRDTSRLISRLRYRQFGIFVTTSYVNEQAYKEIIEDGHPVIIISGVDIANILIDAGFNSIESISKWLETNFPYE